MTERDTADADGTESNADGGVRRRDALVALGGPGLLGAGSQSAAGASGDHLGEAWSGDVDPGLKVQIQQGKALVGGTTSTADNYDFGVVGRTNATLGRGVAGYADNDTGGSVALRGRNQSSDVTGIKGQADATSGNVSGIFGTVQSPSGKGIYATNTATSGTAYGACCQSNSPDGYGLSRPGTRRSTAPPTWRQRTWTR